MTLFLTILPYFYIGVGMNVPPVRPSNTPAFVMNTCKHNCNIYTLNQVQVKPFKCGQAKSRQYYLDATRTGQQVS